MQNGYFTQRIGKIISEENDMGVIELYFKYKFVIEIISCGIGIVALIVCILALIIRAKGK